MQTLFQVALFLVLVVEPGLCAAAQEDAQTATERRPVVLYSKDRLTVHAQDISVKEILNLISRQTGVEIVLHDQISETVTVQVENAALDEGIQRILAAAGGKNFALECERESMNDTSSLRRIWVVKAFQGTVKPKEALKEGDLIEYHSGRLRVQVNDIDVVRLLNEIENVVTANRTVPLRIVLHDEVDQKLSVRDEGPFTTILDTVVRSMRPGIYAPKYISSSLVKQKGGQFQRITIYEIRKLAPEEEERRRKQVAENIEKGKEMFKSHEHTKAGHFFIQALELDPKEWEAQRYMALSAMQTWEFDRAIEKYKVLAANGAATAEDYCNLARAYTKKLDYENILETLEQCVQLISDPRKKELVLNELLILKTPKMKRYYEQMNAAELLQRNRKYDDALGIYLALEKEGFITPELLGKMVLTYFELRQPAKALDAVEELIRKDPYEVHYWNWKAFVHQMLDDRLGVLAALERVLELQPTGDVAERARNVVEHIKRQKNN